MPNTFIGLSIPEIKQNTADITSVQKANLLILNTEAKQNQHRPVITASDINFQAETFSPISKEKPVYPEWEPPEETLVEATARGASEALQGVPMAGWGILAGGAAIAESIVGPGGVATDMKKAAVSKYSGYQEEMAKYSRPEDSLTTAYNKAVDEGDFGAMASWFAHGSGYVGSQLASLFAGSGLIAKGVELTSKKAVTQIMGGLVRKEAERLAEKSLIEQGIAATTESIGKVAITDAILKNAISTVTKKVGERVGMGSVAFGLEGSGIGGTLTQQSVKEDRALTGKEIGKGLAATTAAGAVEYLELALGLKAFKGKLGSIPKGVSKTLSKVDDVSGISGRLARGGITVAKTAPAEGIQESIQTGIEQWGTGKDPMSEESRKEQIDAFGLGALGGGLVSTGALTKGSTSEQKISKEKQDLDRIVKAKVQPGYEEKVIKVVETEDITKYTDQTSKEYNPIIAINALSKIEQKEDSTPLDKDAVYEQAREVYNTVVMDLISTTKALKEVQGKTDLTPKDEESLRSLTVKYDSLNAIVKEITPVISSMNKPEPADPAQLEKIKETIQKSDSAGTQETILDIYGSMGSIDIDEDLVKSVKTGDPMEEPIKRIVVSKKADNALRKAAEMPITKGKQEVYTDVISGGPGFVGKDQRMRSISNAVKADNIDLAKTHLNKLVSFAQEKQTRATTFSNYMSASISLGKSISTPEQAKAAGLSQVDIDNMAVYNKARTANNQSPYSIGPGAFEKSVNYMQLEADALNAAIPVAESLIGFKTKEIKTPTKQEVKPIKKEAVEPSVTPEVDFYGSEETPVTIQEGDYKKLEDMSADELLTLWRSSKDRSSTFRDKIVTLGKAARLKEQMAVTTKKEITKKKPIVEINKLIKKIDTILEKIKDKDTYKHYTTGDTYLKKLYDSYLKGGISYTSGNKESIAPIPIEALKFAELVYEQNFAEFKGDTPGDNVIHTDVIETLINRLVDSNRIISSSKYIQVKDNTSFTEGNYNWTNQKVGSEFVNTLLCHRTSKHTAQMLKTQQIPTATILMGQKDISNKTNIVGDHTVAIAKIDNTYYIVDQPQKEILHPLKTPKTNTTIVKSTEFKPRFIEATVSNIQKYYGETVKGAETTVQDIQQTELEQSISDPVTVVNETLKEVNAEYGTNLSLTKSIPTTETVTAAEGLAPKSEQITGEVVEDITEDLVIAEELTTPDPELNLTDEERTDITNFNPVREQFEVSGNDPGIFNRVWDVIKYIKEGLAEKRWSDNDQVNAINSLVHTSEGLNNSISTMFKPKKLRYQIENPLNYLLIDGELPPNVLTAMSSVSYKWLSTQGQATIFNDEQQIQGLLGLPSSATISNKVKEILKDVGSSDQYLSTLLGREALKLIQIKPTDKAPLDLKPKIEKSLGLMMLAAMQRQGYLKRTYINMGTVYNEDPVKNIDIEQATTGLYGLANTIKNDQSITLLKQDILIEAKDITNPKHKGKTISSFFAVDKITTEDITTTYKKAKGFWEQLFDLPKDEQEYSFEKPDFTNSPEQFPLVGGDGFATKEQTDNLKQSIAMPYTMNGNVANLFFYLDRNSRLDISGRVDESKVHAFNVEGALSKNNSINRSIDNIKFWIYNAGKTATGYASKFYIPAVFQANNRMRHTGSIQTQNDKIHRAMFDMDGWKTTINSDSTQAEQDINYVLFMEAVGQSLGIEVSKELSIEDAITKTEETLQLETMQEALKEIDSWFDITDTNNLYDPQTLIKTKQSGFKFTNKLVEAVKLGGENIHTLRGLIDYQRYQRYLKSEDEKTFTYYLPVERDGIANGPTISAIQFRLSGIDSAYLSRLSSGGLVFQEIEEKSPQMHKLSFDPYESIGAVWGNLLSSTRNAKIEEAKNSNFKTKQDIIHSINVMDALDSLMGKLYDESGYLSKKARKLAKGRSVGALYGSGKTSIISGLFNNTFIQESIIDKLETVDDSEMSILTTNIQTITGFKDVWITSPINNKKGFLSYRLNNRALTALQTAVEIYHGEALFDAISEVYGDIQKAREPLNRAITLLAARYNAALKTLVDAHEGPLTIEAFKAIRKKLEPLLPTVQTPMGGTMPLYDYASISTKGKESNKVEQYYNNPEGVTYVSSLKGYITAYSELANPGVKPIPTMVHMVDSMVSNPVLGNKSGMAILNIHDGIVSSVSTAQEVSKLANETFTDLMTNYSIPTAINDTLKTTLATFNTVMADYIKDPVLVTNLKATYRKFNLDKPYKNAEGNKVKPTLKQVSERLTKEVNSIETITNQNRKMLMDSLTYMNQYHDFRGGAKTENKPKEMINGLSVKDILINAINIKSLAAQKNMINMGTSATSIEETVNSIITEPVSDDTLGSGDKVRISIDPADYIYHKEIDKMNALDIYNQIKNDSTVTDDITHDQHLQRILSEVIQKVLNPVDIHMKTNSNIQTQGLYVPSADGKSSVFISNQDKIISPVSGMLNQGLRMSTGEVYTHELLHSILRSGLELNGHLAAQVDTLYRLTYKTLGKDGYKQFLNDPTIDVNDKANRFEVAAAKERYDYIFRSPDTREFSHFEGGIDPATGIRRTHKLSNHLHEFMAFALSNKNFLRATTGITLDKTSYSKSSWSEFKGKNIQEILIAISQKIFDFFYNKFSSRPESSNVAQELERLALELSKKDSQHKSALFEGIQKLNDMYTKFGIYANKYIKKAFTNAPVLRIANDLKSLGTAAKSGDSLLSKQLQNMEYSYQKLDYGLTKSLVTEFAGKTKRMAWLHKLLSRRKLYLDEAKTSETATYKKLAQSFFKKPVNKVQSVAITKVGIKPDLVTILDTLGLDKISDCLTDNKVLQKQIDGLLKQIGDDSSLSSRLTYYQRASDALGYYMITGNAREDSIPFFNTKLIAIAAEIDGMKALTNEQVTKAVSIIDQLATLYAIKYVPQEQKTVFASLVKEDPEAITNVLLMHKVLKDNAAKDLFDPNGYQFIKGYTKQILNTKINYKQGTLAEEEELIKAGYTRSIKPILRDSSDPTRNKDVYIYTARTGRINDYLSMIFSFTGNKSKGTDSRQIAQQLDLSTAEGKLNNLRIIKAKKRILNRMADPNYTPSNKPGNYMMPQVDNKGRIVKYRYMMSEATKDTYLEQINDFGTVLGAMAGQIIDKVRSPKINTELINGLVKMYSEEYRDNPEAFLEVSPYSDSEQLRELYYMMPEKAKMVIKQAISSGRLYVAKDVLAIAFGYREYSIVNAFSKDPKDRAVLEKLIVNIANTIFKQYGVTVVNNTEMLFIELSKLAKNNIIVKTLSVTLSNLGSNLIYLKGKGISIPMIVKLGWEAVAMGTKYQADKQKLDELKLKEKLLIKQNIPTSSKQYKDLNFEMRQLINSIARNPTTITIEAGLMPTLVDDVETTISGTNFPNPVEKVVQDYTGKLPEVIQTVGKVAFLSQDTSAYKVLNNAVKMTDFIGRHILYTYYTTTKGKDHKTHEEAVAEATEEFVNFNTPTHKIVEYLNKIGLVWFTKYAIRIQKTIGKAIMDKPFEVAMATLLASELGWDNINNSFMFNPIDKVGFPVESFIDSTDEIITYNMLETVIGK